MKNSISLLSDYLDKVRPWSQQSWQQEQLKYFSRLPLAFHGIGFLTIYIFVRLSDRSSHREEQKKDWAQDLWIISPMLYWLC